MRFYILQIRAVNENRPYLFSPQALLLQYSDTSFPPPKHIYDCVYTANQPHLDPSAVYARFNNHHPADYHARSLSVGDVLRYELPNHLILNLFCDSFGFEAVDFRPEYKIAKAAQYDRNADTGLESVTMYYQRATGVTTFTITMQQLLSGSLIGVEESGISRPLTPAELYNALRTCARGRHSLMRDWKANKDEKAVASLTPLPMIPVNERFMELAYTLPRD